MLTSEIASMMPGTLHVTENYFVWTDPMSVQNQAHVLDKATAEEVGSLIDIGQGPDEYIAPIYTVGEGNTLLACDISRKQIGYYALDSLRAKGNPLLKREDADIFRRHPGCRNRGREIPDIRPDEGKALHLRREGFWQGPAGFELRE